MRKICAIIVSITLLICSFSSMASAAEEDMYTYARYDQGVSEVVYQTYEGYMPMEDYAAANTAEEAMAVDYTGRVYGIFSFMLTGGAMVTDQDPISGNYSLRVKNFMDARRWTINTEAPLDRDTEAYVFEFLVRFDAMPKGSRFQLKISDFLSAERDSENSNNPILYFTSDGEAIKLYNLDNKELADVEAGKTYKIAVACDIGTSDYYVFLNDAYIPGSKAVFNCTFNSVYALRFDLNGKDSVITLDDMVLDGCRIKKAGGTDPEPTEAPATESPATEKPTAEASPTSAPTDNSSGTAAVTPSAAAPENTPADSSDSASSNTGVIIGVIIAAVVVAAGIVIAVVVSKKKKK